ncbi:MAG: glycoside hydrolase family 2 TIM barrel-domain containing protein [Bacteroidota bacterium]
MMSGSYAWRTVHLVCIAILLVLCGGGNAARAQIASLPSTFSVRTVEGIAVPFQSGKPAPLFEKQRRVTVGLGGLWRKQRFAANDVLTMGLRDSAGYTGIVSEAAGRILPSYDDGGWATKIIPGVENTLNGFNVRPEIYEDGVWYRRSFDLPDTLNGRMARLMFYAVNYVADVWLNGVYLGYHEGGYTPFAFDATSALRFDTTNVLVVRVDNPAWGSRNDIVPYGTVSHRPDWFNYTGIIHDVYLEFAQRMSLARVEAVPLGTDGSVQLTAVLWNTSGTPQTPSLAISIHEAIVDSTTVQSEVSAALAGQVVASAASGQISVAPDSVRAWRETVTIAAPKLWSPKHPELYILRAVLLSGADTLDELCTQFGIRTVATQGNTVLLNGKPMFFPGVARHEDHYLYGRSVPASVIFNDLNIVLGLNATFLRTAHYPNHPYTYLIADRLGIAVMEEIPVWWFDESDAWLKQDFLRHIHEQMWREMLFRDRNRPSILFWSTCNECLDQTNRRNFIQRLNAELDAQYPDGRLVTESAAADRPGPGDPTQQACDVAGWTMYFGIFHGGTYYGGTRQFLTDAKTSNPGKPILNTEFGYWSTEDLSEAARQVTVFDSTFAAFNEFVAVDSTGVYHPGNPLTTTTWWCVFDWFTVITGNQTMGLYTMNHTTAKPVANRLRSTYFPFKQMSETALVGVVDDRQTVPGEFRLLQNYPNPFNPATTIIAEWPTAGPVRLTVYDILGREVARLIDGKLPAGRKVVEFDARRLASGVYFYRLVHAGRVATKQMLLVR